MAAGTTIRNGKRLAEIDGQPLFALAGKVPAWRDLTPGESGPDVRELQEALAKLGYYDSGDLAGYYGPATEYAVSLYFEHFGYPPPYAKELKKLPALLRTTKPLTPSRGKVSG